MKFTLSYQDQASEKHKEIKKQRDILKTFFCFFSRGLQNLVLTFFKTFFGHLWISHSLIGHGRFKAEAETGKIMTARRASYQPVATDNRKSLIILFRGEAERAGGNRQHGFSEELETFKANMESFFEYLVKPLVDTQKYKLAIFADLRAQEDRTIEIKTFLRKCFGKVFLASRVQLELLGRSQIDSIGSVRRYAFPVKF